MREVVYTPESRVRHPGDLLRDMLESLWASRELAWRLTVRDISGPIPAVVAGVFLDQVPADTDSLLGLPTSF